MLDYGECSKAVIFEFKEPIIIVERSGPLQEGAGLEIGVHAETIRISGARRFSANGNFGSVSVSFGNRLAEKLPFGVNNPTTVFAADPLHIRRYCYTPKRLPPVFNGRVDCCL
jgi:hypothetical protein